MIACILCSNRDKAAHRYSQLHNVSTKGVPLGEEVTGVSTYMYTWTHKLRIQY